MAGVEQSSGDHARGERWALTKEAFDRMLASLDSDAEVAAEKYLLIRRNLVRFFEGRGCRFGEDHADEAINRLAKRLDAGEDIRDPNSYCYGVARLMLLEILKEREREDRALKELPALRIVQSDSRDDDEMALRLECLTHCLEKLPTDGRQMILAYYQGDKRLKIESRKRMAETLGIPGQALRSRVLRLREKLETCVSTCLRKKQSATVYDHG